MGSNLGVSPLLVGFRKEEKDEEVKEESTFRQLLMLFFFFRHPPKTVLEPLLTPAHFSISAWLFVPLIILVLCKVLVMVAGEGGSNKCAQQKRWLDKGLVWRRKSQGKALFRIKSRQGGVCISNRHKAASARTTDASRHRGCQCFTQEVCLFQGYFLYVVVLNPQMIICFVLRCAWESISTGSGNKPLEVSWVKNGSPSAKSLLVCCQVI